MKRAAEQIGGGAERFALHVKGGGDGPLRTKDADELSRLAMRQLPLDRAMRFASTIGITTRRLGWPHAMEGSRTLGILQRIPMDYLGPGKVRNYKALNDIWSGADALDLSLFAVAPTRILRLDEMAELLAAVTGWETSYEIMRFGERRNHLMRVYNLREGLTAADDTLPDRILR